MMFSGFKPWDAMGFLLGSTGALLRSSASDPLRLARLLPKVPLGGERRRAMLLARLYECVASAQKQVGKAGEDEENIGKPSWTQAFSRKKHMKE